MPDTTLLATQRGWVGLVVILIALAVVALLAKDALMQYGLLPGATPGVRSAERSAVPPAGITTSDPTTATPSFNAPIERARSVGDMLQKQAGERADRQERASP